MKYASSFFAVVLITVIMFSGAVLAASFDLGRAGKLDAGLAAGGTVYPGITDRTNYTAFLELSAKYSVPVAKFTSFNADFAARVYTNQDKSGEVDLYLLFKPTERLTVKGGVRGNSAWDYPAGSVQGIYMAGQTYIEAKYVIW